MSSWYQAYAWAALQEAGVTTVIDLREKDKTERLPKLCKQYEMTYFHYPVDISADAIAQIVERFPQLCELLDAGDFYIKTPHSAQNSKNMPPVAFFCRKYLHLS